MWLSRAVWKGIFAQQKAQASSPAADKCSFVRKAQDLSLQLLRAAANTCAGAPGCLPGGHLCHPGHDAQTMMTQPRTLQADLGLGMAGSLRSIWSTPPRRP